jgi:hypothetical protein
MSAVSDSLVLTLFVPIPLVPVNVEIVFNSVNVVESANLLKFRQSPLSKEEPKMIKWVLMFISRR